MFTDIVGYTALMSRDEKAALALLQKNRALQKALAEKHNGEFLKEMGDGTLLCFQSALDAVRCAMEIQESVKDDPDLNLRIGIHLGDIVFREGDVFGDGVNVASRIEKLAGAGSICVSEHVFQSVKNQPDMNAVFLEEKRLKNVDHPVKIYDITVVESRSNRSKVVIPKNEAESKKHNLPNIMTRFIGREKEVKEVKKYLSENPLVTITGPGGCGKTRLSIETVRSLLGEYRDGIWMVELASVSDPSRVAETAAGVLQIKENPNEPLVDTLAYYLKHRQLLLLLDNCEHLIESCAELVNQLLGACPDLKILATSREVLNTQGEAQWVVPSLTMPDLNKLPGVDKLDQYEAIQLFVDRTKSYNSKFTLSSKNAETVAHICHHLDGIPLAIELAAARVEVLGVEGILDRLDQRFQVLTGGKRTAQHRHKTLKAVVEWSYDLLTKQERTLFNRVSVFFGGFDLEAVDHVCSGGLIKKVNVLDLVSSLIYKSLIVTFTRPDGSIRYDILETLRHFGYEKLVKSGELESLNEKHFHYYLHLADAAFDARLDETAKWLNRLELEHANLIAALKWAGKRPELFIQLAGALGWFWQAHSHYTTGIAFLENALKHNGERNFALARALSGFGFLGIFNMEYFNKAKKSLELGIEIWRDLGNRRELGLSLSREGWISYAESNNEKGWKCIREADTLFQELGDPSLIVQGRTWLAWAHVAQIEPDKAEPISREALDMAIELNMPEMIMGCRHTYADCALLRQDYMVSQKRYGKALQAALDIGNVFQACGELQGVAMSYAGLGRYSKSLRLNGAILAKSDDLGAELPPLPFWVDALEKTIGRAKEKLSKEKASPLEEEGRKMGFEKAIEYALDFDKD